jgi:hypothetical protein
MSFKKMTVPKYPPRHWALVGFPGSGKSTFATQMRGPLLPIDADQRFAEVLALAAGDVYRLSENPADNVAPAQIARLLEAHMPGSDVGTIVVDSLTTLIAPLIVRGMLDNEAGENKNKMAGFIDKALVMRLLQDAVTRWGTHTLWIWHLQRGRNEKAEKVVTATLPKTELERLRRSLNVELHLVADEATQRRGVKVVWTRQAGARSGMTLWDESGTWQGMPERIEAAIYDAAPVESQPGSSPAPASVTPSPAESHATAATTAAASSANGHTRPLDPETLRAFLERRADEHAQASHTATNAQKGLVATALEICFAGDAESETNKAWPQAARRNVLAYLVGIDSLASTPDSWVLALYDWLKPRKDSGGQWLPDSIAEKEARQVFQAQAQPA